MFCPNCGRTNSEEQRFCRACGFSLEKTLQSLAEQLPARELDSEIRNRQRAVERLLRIVGIGAVSLVVGAVLWGIIFEVIIAKGEILAGSLFLVFVLALIIFALLSIYRESLAKSSAKSHLANKEIASTDGLTMRIAPGTEEPPGKEESMPSVTENTTELLDAESADPKKI
jgi:hypothetical protein